MRSSVLAAIAIAAAASLPDPAVAAGSYDDCSGFISSLPAVISTSGRWCVDRDLGTGITSGHAITAAADGVTIDCNGFRITRGPALSSNTANGLYASGRHGVTVRGCHLQGFYRAVYLAGGTGHLVERNQSVSSLHVGLRADGAGTRIVDNRIENTGRSSVASEVHAIQTRGSTHVSGNAVHGLFPNPTAGSTALYGITVINNVGGTVLDNVVTGYGGDPPDVARGIVVTGGGYLVLRRNQVSGDDGLASTGIACDSAKPVAVSNVVTRFTTGVDTCRDAGDNIVKPVLN